MHTALCTLHADMRMKEMLCNTAERALRTKAEGNAGCECAKAFNRTCKDDLKLRHRIAFDETGKVRNSALDGKDCKLLNEDWLLLEHDDLEAQPPVWNKNGSKYFRSLADARERRVPRRAYLFPKSSAQGAPSLLPGRGLEEAQMRDQVVALLDAPSDRSRRCRRIPLDRQDQDEVGGARASQAGHYRGTSTEELADIFTKAMSMA